MASGRHETLQPAELFRPQFWTQLVQEAERGLLDLVTLEDRFAASRQQDGDTVDVVHGTSSSAVCGTAGRTTQRSATSTPDDSSTETGCTTSTSRVREARALPRSDDDLALVADRLATQFVGTPGQVADQLQVLQETTGADELLVTTITHDHDDRVRSFQLLAKEWQQR